MVSETARVGENPDVGPFHRRATMAPGYIRWVAVAMTLIVVGCATEQTDITTSTTSASVDTTFTELVETTVSPTSTTENGTTTTAPGSAPAELQGRWTGSTPDGKSAQLTLVNVSYTAVIGSGPSRAEGNGRILVEDDTIVFINPSPLFCSGEGRGTYLWSVEGGVLRFEPVGVDECGPRVPHLVGIEYTLTDTLD